jgi:hypothetical protein
MKVGGLWSIWSLGHEEFAPLTFTLGLCMPPLLPKIAAFWLFVHLALWLLRRMPNSRLAMIAFAWQGPYPTEGERMSSYYRRKAWFAIGWLIQILTVAAVVSLVVWLLPRSEDTETAVIVVAFAFTIGSGMAVLGAVFAGLASAKALLLGPNPEFHIPPPEELVSAEDSEA